jgi:APA family basic amino acid/polyamine antiporter
VLASLWLMLNLQTSTWIRFGVWMLVGFVVYFGYSVRHSRVGKEGGGPREEPARRQPDRVPAGTPSS